MRKLGIYTILGGAALTALSILFIYLGGGFAAAGFIMLAVGIVAFVSGVLALIHISKSAERRILPEGARYSKRKALLTPPEFDFLLLLRGIVDLRRCEILPQVALSAVIDKINAAFRNELFRTVDFCIADSTTFEPLLLIELNDKSHERDDRRLRDEKVRAICESARMPLVSFTLAEATDMRLVAGRIRRFIK